MCLNFISFVLYVLVLRLNMSHNLFYYTALFLLYHFLLDMWCLEYYESSMPCILFYMKGLYELVSPIYFLIYSILIWKTQAQYDCDIWYLKPWYVYRTMHIYINHLIFKTLIHMQDNAHIYHLTQLNCKFHCRHFNGDKFLLQVDADFIIFAFFG